MPAVRAGNVVLTELAVMIVFAASVVRANPDAMDCIAEAIQPLMAAPTRLFRALMVMAAAFIATAPSVLITAQPKLKLTGVIPMTAVPCIFGWIDFPLHLAILLT